MHVGLLVSNCLCENGTLTKQEDNNYTDSEEVTARYFCSELVLISRYISRYLVAKLFLSTTLGIEDGMV